LLRTNGIPDWANCVTNGAMFLTLALATGAGEPLGVLTQPVKLRTRSSGSIFFINNGW